MDFSHRIDLICNDEHSLVTERLEAVSEIDSAQELYLLLDHFNWDDEFAVPHAIADHPLCDLAIAQRLYWLSSAADWYQSEAQPNVYQKDWFDFSNKLISRLLDGFYKVGRLSHSEEFNRVSLYYFKKENVPEIFYKPVVGENA